MQSGMITGTVCHYILNNGILCNIYAILISAWHMVFRIAQHQVILSHSIYTLDSNTTLIVTILVVVVVILILACATVLLGMYIHVTASSIAF